jgi:hypothetical protein
MTGGDFLNHFRLLGHASLSAVEFYPQRRCDRQIQFRIFVDCVHLRRVSEFDTRPLPASGWYAFR